jgi:hypothetical protein
VSVWNRIGDLASSAGKGVFNSANWLGERAVSFGGDIAGLAGAPAKFAWDVGTAPWNDDEEYNASWW